MSDALSNLQSALEDRYRLERELGAGGMATVYLADDLKHDRRVAIKVLRPELSAILGADRFLNEIKVTANLQHPHILALYDSGSADGHLYYVMPFIEGESLRDRLGREKQLPVDDAIAITRAVASALDYAHRHGVIHRDIKPENILLHDGQPTVADFGIALAVSAAGGSRLTETGLSLGTPHYMSPEQATGDRDLDGRSDLYALACVAYELLAGDPPHMGSTAQAIIAKIVTEAPPPLGVARPTVPEHVAAAIHKALAKLPADRFATAGQFAEALARPGAIAQPAALPSTAAAVSRRGRWITLGLAAVALVVGLLLGRSTLPGGDGDAKVMRFVIPISLEHRLTAQPSRAIGLTPDGSGLVYAGVDAAGESALFLRRFESLDPVEVPGTRGTWGAVNPFFSPDGRWLGFEGFNSREISKVPADGGALVRIGVSANGGASWTDDGRIVYKGPQAGLMVASENGGGSSPMTTPDSASGELHHLFPAVLPGSEAILVTFTARGLATPRLGGTGIAVVWPGTGQRKVLIENEVAAARYSPTGHIVYAREDGALLAAPFDLSEMEMTAPPTILASDVLITGGSGVPVFDISREGTLAYVSTVPAELVLVDRAGNATPITEEPQSYHSPRFSPDGRRIAFDLAQPTGRDVWVYDQEQRTLTRVTFEGDANDPVWAPDGRRVCYGSAKTGIRGAYCRPADGTGQADSVYVRPDDEFNVGVWHPSGSEVVLISFADAYNLVLVPAQGGEAEPVVATEFAEEFPALSPDGRWLAYTSDESGRRELYVRALRGEGGRTQVSQHGASEIVWSRDAREIFYLEQSGGGQRLVAARLETAPAVRVVSRTPLFDVGNYETAAPHANYDVHPDGQRFVMVRRAAPSEVVIIKNWPAEVESAARPESR
jgi:serine/threonine-protein kinase